MYGGDVRAYQTYLVQIDDIQVLASDAMEQITLLIQEDDLHQLKLLGKFSSGDVDIEDLAVRRLSQAGKNGQCACSQCSDGCLDGTPIDTSDVSDKVVG